MQRYIGTKIIMAMAMSLGEYNSLRGWDQPEDEDPEKEGYLVEYLDSDDKNHPDFEHYISWSPKEPFDADYVQTSGLTFGMALEAMKKGKLVARSGWNGKGMFIFMRPGDELSADMIINKVKSLPDAVKSYYAGQFSHTAKEEAAGKGPKDVFIKFTPYICMKAADDTIVNGWLASQTDMTSSDWEIIG